MKTHPLADLFPPMTTEEMASLVEDIKASGLAQPIVTHEGAILDGRHGYLACLQAGVEPQFTEFRGGGARGPGAGVPLPGFEEVADATGQGAMRGVR
jgi:hypothetical protein